MRKLLSYLLILTVILTSVSVGIGIFVNASEAPETFTVDFEGKYSEFYTDNCLTDPTNTADTANIGGAQGTVMHVEQLRAYRPRSENHTVSNWAAAFFLADSNGNKVSYEKGQKLAVSFKMKKNSDISTEYFNKFSIGAIFDDGLEQKVANGNIGSINNYINEGKLVVVDTADCNKDTDWVDYAGFITVPNSGIAAFVLFGEEWAVNCDVYVDDIVIKKDNGGEVSYKVDFEDGYSDFYKNNYLTDPDAAADVKNIGGEHGTVMHVKDIRAYRPNLGEHTVTKWSAAFFLADSSGNKISFEKGDNIEVSFQMKKNEAISEEEFNQFFAAFIFDDDLANKVANQNIGSLNDYIGTEKAVDVASFDCKADSDFVTYANTITVSNSGTAAFVLYNKEWTEKCDIYIDNIIIKKVDKSNAGDTVDFEGSYTNFYQTNCLTDSGDVADVKHIGGEHGTVMHVKDIRAYRPDITEESNNYSVTKWSAAFFLADSSGNKLSYEKDKIISVSFQMKKNEAVDDSEFDKFYAALIFDDDLANKVANQNIGSLNDYIGTEKAVDVASFDCKADTDFVTYSNVVTVPNTGTAALVIYNKDWRTECNIYIDNINIKPIDAGATVDIKVNNYDGKGGSQNISVSENAIFADLETPFCADKKFDGWYLDSGLTKKASGFVGKTAELWIKWRTEPHKTVNTYDESGVEFIEEKDGDYILVKREINGAPAGEKYFSQYNAQVIENEFDENAGNSSKITVAHGYTYNWPAALSIYDSNDENLKVFTPKPNTAYKLKMKYKADLQPAQALNIQLRCLAGDSKIQYVPENIVCESVTEISLANKDWVTVEKIFYTGDSVSNLALILCTVNSTTYGSSAEDVCVWVDDIEITEEFNAPALYFDSVGGTSVSKQPVVVNESIPTMPIPSKGGHVFEGWFYDAACTQSFDKSVMPAENIKLYAKWKEVAAEPYLLEKDFENDEYINNGTKENVFDSYMSNHAEWVNNPVDAYDGDSYIKILDKGTEKFSSTAMPAISFLNEDGSAYELIEGKRYHISVAMRCSVAASHYLVFATSEQTPVGGLNLKSATEEYSYGYSDLLSNTGMGQWGVYDFYFIAKNTGKLYLILYGDGEIAEISIDNFKIEQTPEGEASLVRYYDDDGSLLTQEYGAVGSWLPDADIVNRAGCEFEGWYYKNGDRYLGSRFPAEDTEFYAKWELEEDLTDAKTDWSEDVVIDFEDAEGCKAFYGVYNNSYEPLRGTFYVANDPENAHTGSGYYKLYQVGVWGADTWYRRFKFYDSNTLGNQVYLEPNSVYKVSYWLNVERAGNSCVRLVAFESRTDLIECYYEGYNYLTDATEISNIGKWVKHESTITTGDEPTVLGMAISGGYFTAALDDVTVTKLRDVKVSFETNGGSKIEPLTVLSYDYAIAPDFPEREGYSFAGWFADKELTKRFRFNEVQVVEDITVYAKWEKNFVSETVTETVTEYEKVEEEVENIPEDAHLDEAIEVDTSDKPSPNKKADNSKSDSAQDSSSNIWIIIIAVAVVLLLSGGAILFIILKKRKNGGKV